MKKENNVCKIDIPEILFTDCDYFNDRQDETPMYCVFCYRYDVCLEYYKKVASAQKYKAAKGE